MTTSTTTSSTTVYYSAGAKRLAASVNGTLTYLAGDELGSAEVALDASGNVQASALDDPYGAVRYSMGAMPGSYGFTGQHSDALTGLDDCQFTAESAPLHCGETAPPGGEPRSGGTLPSVS